jgi:hypothetical protein
MNLGVKDLYYRDFSKQKVESPGIRGSETVKESSIKKASLIADTDPLRASI